MTDENQDLIERCTKMSFLLGMVTGALLEFIRDDSLPLVKKQPFIELLGRLTNGIDELYGIKRCENEI